VDYGVGNIKVLGCFSRDEVGLLHRVEGNMNKLVDSVFLFIYYRKNDGFAQYGADAY
jgi:hypothetical protein